MGAARFRVAAGQGGTVEAAYDVVVVGGGPAGASAALQLAHNGLAGSTLLLDAAHFPREKLCGGGLVRRAEQLLAHLGVDLRPVPAVPIHAVRVEYEGGRHLQRGLGVFRVVRREELDHALLRAVEARRVAVRQGEPVLALERGSAGIRVVTPCGAYRARVVIGADGAASRVRRALVGPAAGERMVALEVLSPGYPDAHAHEAVFDFRPVAAGLRGYAWDFPSLRRGRRWMNRGIGGSRWPRGRSLRELFAEALALRGLELRDLALEAWSAPAYDPASPQGAEGVLLAGDAVGVDPWLGEGITSAIGSGMLAAHAASEGLARGRLGFGDHHERLRESAVGWQLLRNAAIADPFYQAAAKPRGLEALIHAGAP
jgi:geranylgeranyl reductase family protein